VDDNLQYYTLLLTGTNEDDSNLPRRIVLCGVRILRDTIHCIQALNLYARPFVGLIPTKIVAFWTQEWKHFYLCPLTLFFPALGWTAKSIFVGAPDGCEREYIL